MQDCCYICATLGPAKILRCSINIFSLLATPAAFVRLPFPPRPWVKFRRLSRPERRRTMSVNRPGDRFVSLSQSLPCGARRRLHRWPGHPSTPNPQLNPEGRVHKLSKGQVEAMRARPWGDRSLPVHPSAPTPMPITGTPPRQQAQAQAQGVE